jgi:hypothetical protein
MTTWFFAERRFLRPLLTFLAAGTLAAAPALVQAQWLSYPTPGVPRTAGGKPDLSAPAPKVLDGKPDLSGVWEIEHNRPCPPEGCADMEVGQEFVNIGWSLKGGLPYRPWAADLVKVRIAQNGKDDPGSHCLPTGIVKMHTTPLYRKIVQIPGLVIILNERNTSFRQIFTDGRPMPRIDQPTFDGYSSGKWDGDTLVVETAGFSDGLWLDRDGSPMTDAARITEKFRRVNYGRLEIEMTVDDPKAYAAPWTVTLNQFIRPDTDLLNYTCLENEQDISHLVGK